MIRITLTISAPLEDNRCVSSTSRFTKLCQYRSNFFITFTPITMNKCCISYSATNTSFSFQRMSEVYKIQENRIKLDIGGQQFTTSMLTLLKDPNSMFAAMFSGRHKLRQESDGSYFIDRDGAHFRYILNYLRDGCIKEGTLPSNDVLWGELLNEAEYYQLTGLVEYLKSLMNRSVSRSNSNMSNLSVEDT